MTTVDFMSTRLVRQPTTDYGNVPILPNLVPNLVLGVLTEENVSVHIAGSIASTPGTFSCHTIPFSDKTLSMRNSVCSVVEEAPV